MDGAWINIADYAVGNALPFWCDDLVLRGLVRQAGCTTFGTIELIGALEAAGELDADAECAQAQYLLYEFHALFEFDEDLFADAAALDQWRARGVAVALTLPETWRAG